MIEPVGREQLLAMLLARTPDHVVDAVATPAPQDAADLAEVRDSLAELALEAEPVAPPARLRERLLASRPRVRRPRRPVLVVLDMINDHLTPGRPLEVPRARDIVPALKARLADARAHGVPVIYACDGHAADDPDYGYWPVHALDGTEGAEVWPEIAPEPGDRLVRKPTYSAFQRSELGKVLEDLGADEIILTGCATELGLQATAVDALQRGYVVKVPPDSQAGVTAIAEQVTLLTLSTMPPYDPISCAQGADPPMVETLRLPADAGAIARAAALIRAGKLVAFPTETVYGLGARADDAAAVRAIFAAKGRPPTNPLIVHVADLAAARALAASFPAAAEALARAFWPGPLTLVLQKRAVIVDEATASGPTVAVRVPAHPVALALLREAGVPIAAPSANRSTAISPTTADHVLKSLAGRIDLVLDGGPTGGMGGVAGAGRRALSAPPGRGGPAEPPIVMHGIESTIVDVTRSPAVLLRQGAIPLAALRAHAEVIDPGALVVAEGERAPAPGAHARHYAPKARVILTAAASVRAEVAASRAKGTVTGALERAPATVERGPAEVLPDDPAGYAAGLYAALHRLEDAGCEIIVIAETPAEPAWAAVRDRLGRASA